MSANEKAVALGGGEHGQYSKALHGDFENGLKIRPRAALKQEPEPDPFDAPPEVQPRSGTGLLTPFLHHAANGDLGERIKRTFPGQAGWAVLDSGKTCREWWSFADKDGQHRRDARGALREAWCWKFRQLRRRWGDAIPHDAIACPEFEARLFPPKAGHDHARH
jgi:hypothetical protein